MRAWLAALVVGAAGPALASAQPCPRTMNAPQNTPAQALAAQAARQVLNQVPAGAGYALLLQVGDGSQAEQAGQALRQALACDPRIRFSTVVHQAQAPLPDPSASAGHVNVVTDTVQPWPRLVLRVSESAGTLYIAAREPGRDPLGPPDSGWLWVLQRP